MTGHKSWEKIKTASLSKFSKLDNLATHFALIDGTFAPGEPTMNDPYIRNTNDDDDEDDWWHKNAFYFVCPDCGWKSITMKYRVGANHQAEVHNRICPERS